jgi:hypothetical protein
MVEDITGQKKAEEAFGSRHAADYRIGLTMRCCAGTL